MDLTDAGLRERVDRILDAWEKAVVNAFHGDVRAMYRRDLLTAFVALRDAARAESQEEAETRARDELMDVVAHIQCLHTQDNPHANSTELLACVIESVRASARAEQRERDARIADKESCRSPGSCQGGHWSNCPRAIAAAIRAGGEK